MDKTSFWEEAYLRELENAGNARSEGNEGMARVCARRAAGIVVGEYYARHGIQDIDQSAYERINLLRNDPTTSKEVQQITEHLLLRVDFNHQLPIESDLIAETQQLAKALLY